MWYGGPTLVGTGNKVKFKQLQPTKNFKQLQIYLYLYVTVSCDSRRKKEKEKKMKIPV